ncbi:MAG: hypothetical protein QGH50_03900, partial [SAR324 cluster bacterium]|nr:hypothetical protein [SAR324 cluster bacterium]
DASLTGRFVPFRSRISKTWMNLCEPGDRRRSLHRGDRDARDGCAGIGPILNKPQPYLHIVVQAISAKPMA